MRLRLVILAAATAGLVGCSQAPAPTPKTDEDKMVYALGVLAAKQQIPLQSFELTDQELELVKAGFVDAVRDKQSMDDEAVKALVPKLQELLTKRGEATTKRSKDEGAAYVTKAAAESGATKTASGMVYKSVKEGTGAQPQATDTVKVHYEGRLISGKVFDSSIKRNEPIDFPLNGVIPCWGEGVQKMKVGGKALLVCPPEIAYGEEGRPPTIPGGSTLVFDVELLEIVKPDAAAAAASPHGASPH
jgi:FKBP-type peptidyl-prolyl cis-trans isomerase FkpA